LNNFIFLLQN